MLACSSLTHILLAFAILARSANATLAFTSYANVILASASFNYVQTILLVLVAYYAIYAYQLLL